MKLKQGRSILFIICVICACVLWATKSVSADEITVCPSGCDYNDLSTAVAAANPNDTILVANGNYPANITIDKNLTIRGEGADLTILDGNLLDRVLTVQAGTTLTLTNVSVLDGIAPLFGSTAFGGGIYNLGGLVLTGVILANNGAYGVDGIDGDTENDATSGGVAYGGGIYNGCKGGQCGNITLTQSAIIDNIASGGDGGDVPYENEFGAGNGGSSYGGGIFNECLEDVCATLSSHNSQIQNNKAFGGHAGFSSAWCGGLGGRGRGGGIYTAGNLLFENGTISRNHVSEGASYNCTPYGDGNQSYGGGIFSLKDVTLHHSTISHNKAGYGGGLYIAGGTINSTNSTVSNNQANEAGGGIYNGGDAYWSHVTIAANQVGPTWVRVAYVFGGGLANYGTATLTNSIVAQNVVIPQWPDPNGERVDCFGSFMLQGHNLIGDTTGCTFEGDVDGMIVNPAAGLLDLADNGGLTMTHAYRLGSPALDTAVSDFCPITDQRGVERPLDGNGDETAVCDLGAFESENLVVSKFYLPQISTP